MHLEVLVLSCDVAASAAICGRVEVVYELGNVAFDIRLPNAAYACAGIQTYFWQGVQRRARMLHDALSRVSLLTLLLLLIL